MEVIKWITLLLLSFAFGALYVQFLTAHPLKMSRYLLAASAAFFATGALLIGGTSGVALIVALLLALGSALIGYSWMTRRFLSREDPRVIPELTRAEGDPGQGHTAVVYFAHGEPETYEPIGWINQFREWDEQQIRFVPFLIRPYFFHKLRKQYLAWGRSDHRRMHGQMIKSLERAFRAEGDSTTRFYLSFLDDDPRPDAAVIQALNEGASRIIVSEVFLTISNHTAEGEELIEALDVPARFGVPIHYAGPLYNSETLMRMFVQRANEHIGETEKAKVGILLVGHGQPDEWDEEWPTETEHEIGFRQGVLNLLAADGFEAQNLDLAWMEFKEPKPNEKVEEFVRNGVEKVLYFSTAISADGMHSEYDVPALVQKAKIGEDVSCVNLGAWNDDPFVIQAIKEKIEAVMAGVDP
jgi:protoheme ferro-lyase